MTEPVTKQDICEALARLREEGRREWESYSLDAFAAPIGEAWSPADNVRHLIKSTKPVVTALRMPRPALRMMFGKTTRKSRTFSALRDDYRGALAAGGQAGKFAPSPKDALADVAAWRRELLDEFAETLRSLESAVEPWSEEALDGYVLPHPLIGKLTVREMLFFTLYHHAHHAENARRRAATA